MAAASSSVSKPVFGAHVTPPLPGGRKGWQAGTFAYTADRLAVLFGWLLWGDFA